MAVAFPLSMVVGRPPKVLRKQAADRLALYIIQRSLPLIDVGLDKNMDDQEQHYDKLRHLKHLRQLKNWYWLETSDWLGHRRSSGRQSIGNSLMDVLDWKKSYKRVPTLHRFILQILFSVEAGNLERWPELMIETRDCQMTMQLIRAVSPLYLSKINDVCLRFMDPKVFATIFQFSPELKNINLHLNISTYSLYFLRLCCPNLEAVTLDIETVYPGSYLEIEHHLYQAFFGSMGKESVMEHVKNEDDIILTFMKLDEIVVRYDILSPNLTQLVFCLQHFYPDVKVKQTCMVAMPFDSIQKKMPFVSPTYVIYNKDLLCKQCLVYFQDEKFGDLTGQFTQFLEGSIELFKQNNAFCRNVRAVHNGMSEQPVDAIKYIYYNRVSISIEQTLGDLAETLRELYLFGLIANGETQQNLAQTLDQCKNLKVLTIQVKIKCDPGMKLRSLKKLETLSISFTKFEYLNVFVGSQNTWVPVEQYMKKFMRTLIGAAKNLKILEIPGYSNLRDLIELESFSKIHTLSITEGNADNLMDTVSHFPTLKKLILNRDFGYKKYLSLKKVYKCTDLKVLFKTGRVVLPYIRSGSESTLDQDDPF